MEQLGGVSYVYGHAKGGERVIIERRGPTDARTGEALEVGFEPRHLRIFGADGRRLR